MPPKKRARVSQVTSPAVTDPTKTPTPAAQPDSPSNPDEVILNDPWTDEETIGLFKAIIKWKPTGIHKHFRLLQIHSYLLQNHYISPNAPHTTLSGLWSKLHTLYDLDALDARENGRQLSPSPSNASSSDDDDIYSLADNKIPSAPFALPEEDEFIANEAWKRRFPGEKARRDGSESPAVLPEVNLVREAPRGFLGRLRRAEMGGEEVVVETAEAVQEEKEKDKKMRGRPKGSTVGAKAGAQGDRRRSTRQVAEPSEEEDEEDEDGDESGENEDEEDEEDEGESSEEEEEGSEETTPAPRPNRSGRGRGRPARGSGTGNPRGRPRKK